MKTLSRTNPYPVTASEKRSEKFLMEKMGISKKELGEINSKSGVSFSAMIELMSSINMNLFSKKSYPGAANPAN